MSSRQFQPSDCCVKCPHFDKFGRACTHDLRQAIIQEVSAEDPTTCPVFPEIRAKSMRDLERQLIS
jgi:hypothetical protein